VLEDSKGNCRPGLNAVQLYLFKSRNLQIFQDELIYLYSSERHRGRIYALFSVSRRCTWSDIFKAVNGLSTTGDISRANCVGICTEGAAANSEHEKAFRPQVWQIDPHV
jgi:hypothetical protein